MSRRGENIYKRKDGRWEGRTLISNGKYGYVYGKSYKEAKEKQRHLQNNLKVSIKNKPEDEMDIDKQMEYWLKNCVFYRVKAATYENYYYCVQRYLVPYFSKVDDKKKLSTGHIKEFIQFIFSKTMISESYKRKIISIFKTFIRDLYREASNYGELLFALQMKGKSQSVVQVFNKTEQRRLEQYLSSSSDPREIGILSCFYTGLRLGELCALKWKNLDTEKGTLLVESTLGRTKDFSLQAKKTYLAETTPKSSASVRKIPLPAFLIEIISKNDKPNPDYYVLSEEKNPIDPRTMQRLFNKILVKTELPQRKFHAIRHTFATRALEVGVDMKTLSEILGHSNVSITLNIYAHSLIEQKRLAMDKMNTIYYSNLENNPYSVKSTVNYR